MEHHKQVKTWPESYTNYNCLLASVITGQYSLSVLKVMQIAKTNKIPLKRKYPPNKKSETQLQFFSSKKERLISTPSSLRKPRKLINATNHE